MAWGHPIKQGVAGNDACADPYGISWCSSTATASTTTTNTENWQGN